MGSTKLPNADLYVGTHIIADTTGALYIDGTKVTATAAELNALGATMVKPLIDDGDTGVTISSADQTNAAPTVTIPNIGDAADTFVMENTAATLTLKTLTSPTLTTPKIADGDTGVSITSADQTHAAPTVTIPNCVDAADEFVLKDTAATLTLKTLTAPVMTNPSSTFSIGTHDYGAGTVDWTLSAAELLKMIHKPTNASGGVNAIIGNTAGMPYIFVNGTGQTLTVKTAAGTGIAIANGKTHMLMSDGTNVIAIAAVSA